MLEPVTEPCEQVNDCVTKRIAMVTTQWYKYCACYATNSELNALVKTGGRCCAGEGAGEGSKLTRLV